MHRAPGSSDTYSRGGRLFLKRRGQDRLAPKRGETLRITVVVVPPVTAPGSVAAGMREVIGELVRAKQ